MHASIVFFFFQAEDGIRDLIVTGVQTCALPICPTREEAGGTRWKRSAARPGSACRAPLTSAGGRPRRSARERPRRDQSPAARRGSEERRGGEECRSRWSPYH